MKDLVCKPIGIFHCDKTSKSFAASQGSYDGGTGTGVIELFPWVKPHESLKDLAGFSKLWVLFWFHETDDWKSQVTPPRNSSEKRGLFSTRSPYRPNPIGQSAVTILKIENNKIFVTGFDLIDQTPILDLKPYLPEADSFPEEKAGWTLDSKEFSVEFSKTAGEKFAQVETSGDTEIRAAVQNQLRWEPLNSKRKRLKKLSENQFELSLRFWRITFQMTTEQKITVLDLDSIINRPEEFARLEARPELLEKYSREIHFHKIAFKNSNISPL